MTLLSINNGLDTMTDMMLTNHTDSPLGLLRRLGLAEVFRHLLRQTRYERPSRSLRPLQRHTL